MRDGISEAVDLLAKLPPMLLPALVLPAELGFDHEAPPPVAMLALLPTVLPALASLLVPPLFALVRPPAPGSGELAGSEQASSETSAMMPTLAMPH